VLFLLGQIQLIPRTNDLAVKDITRSQYEGWSADLADLAPETYRWRKIVEDVNGDELPEHYAQQSAVIEAVAEHAGLPESAAEEVVDHAIHLKLLAELDSEPIVYIPENPGKSLGDSNE